MAISAVYHRLGSNHCSGIITNLGVIKLPQEMEALIDSFEVVPTPPNTHVKITSAMVTFKNSPQTGFWQYFKINQSGDAFFKASYRIWNSC